MKTQISRDNFDAKNRYSGVYQQQGRMITDSDWNELVDTVKARLDEALKRVVDTGAPRGDGVVDFSTHPPTLRWGPVFAGGLRGEIVPDPDPYQPGPPSSTLEYDKQLDFPDPPPLPADGNYVLYGDLWERPVFFLENPGLLDPGLHGADTCARTQTMAQLKWCPSSIDPLNDPQNPPKGNATWVLELKSGPATPDPCDPCAREIAIDQGTGNYLFRLEVHDVQGDANAPTSVTLKWSTENGAEHHKAGTEPPGFKSGGWIYEFFSPATEKHLGVHLAPTASPDRGDLETNGYPSSPAGLPPNVRRWDGYCIVSGATVTAKHRGVTLDATQARVYGNNLVLILNNLELRLEIVTRSFVAGDYWLAVVRENAEPGKRVRLLSQDPIGITHHYVTIAAYQSHALKTYTNAQTRRLSFPSLTNLTADRVGYDPTKRETRWKDIKELSSLGTPPRPDTVQEAIDDLIENLESSDVKYELPSCNATSYNVDTFKKRIETLIQNVFLENGKSFAKLDDLLDALLCHLDAAKIPYDPTSKAPRWKDIKEITAPGPLTQPGTVQEAIDDLVENLESSDIAYTLPSCPADSIPGARTVKNLLSAISGWPDLDGDSRLTVKDILHGFLCHLDSTKLPYDVQTDEGTVKEFLDQLRTDVDGKVNRSGDTMTGPLSITNGGLEVRGNREIGALGANLVFNGDWKFSRDGIQVFTGDLNNLSVVQVSDSPEGGAALQVTGANYFVVGDLIPFQQDALYVFEIVARQSTAPAANPNANRIYFGGEGYREDGTTLCNFQGTASHGNQHYVAVSGEGLPAGWTKYTGYLLGTSIPGTSSRRSDPGDPGKFHSNVRFFRPIIYINYPGGDGVAQIASVRVYMLPSYPYRFLSPKVLFDGTIGLGTSSPYTPLHIVSETGAEHPGYGNPMVWGKHIELAATRMWGLQDMYGSLFTWESDSLFLGLKNEGADRKDAVIAFGDNLNDSLRILFTPPGDPPPAPRELMRIAGDGKVGIGVTPSERLEVNGTVKATAFVGDGSGLTGVGGGRWSDGTGGAIYYTGGSVGIGTATPNPFNETLTSLYIKGPTTSLELDGAASGKRWRVVSALNGKLHFHQFTAGQQGAETSNVLVLEHQSGNVGVGVGDPQHRLDVAGAAHASSFPTSSDARFKFNVSPIGSVLEKIKTVRGISFDWNERYAALGRSTGHRELGLIAQEVEAVFPEAVTSWGEEGYKAIDYGRLVAVLIEAVKELDMKCSALNDKIQRR